MMIYDELQKAVKIGEAVNYLHNLYLVEDYEYVVSLAKKGQKPTEMDLAETIKFIAELNIIDESYLTEVAALDLENINRINKKIWEEYGPNKGEK